MHLHKFAVSLSEAAYDDDDINALCDRYHLNLIERLEGPATIGYIIIDSATSPMIMPVNGNVPPRRNCFIVFRGTEPDKIKQWLIDLDARKEPFVGDSHVHSGFRRSVQSIWTPLRKRVFRLNDYRYNFFLFGHSKGAAEAVHTTAKLCHQGIIPEALVTFGQPRVGDRRYAILLQEWMNDRYARYRNNNDVVARVPLALPWIFKYIPYGKWAETLLPLGFAHAGRLYYLRADRTLVFPSKGLWSKLRLAKDHICGRIIAGKDWWHDGIDDHNISLYRELIHEILPH